MGTLYQFEVSGMSFLKNSIQIAGIKSFSEAKMLLDCGVDFLGFPLKLAVHREDIPPETVAEIIRDLRIADRSVLITYLDNADEIFGLMDFLDVSIVQIHGSIAMPELVKLKKQRPELRIIKSLIVKTSLTELSTEIERFSSRIDGFILDSFDPKTGASGATGKTHDWNISRQLIEFSPKPVILAGGLNVKNVRKAIVDVRPAAVDAHTGVEDSNGNKERRLVEKFVTEARNAFNLVNSDEENPVEIPIDGTLDLHTFQPHEVKELLTDYLAECRRRGIFQVRIIHGKGTGALRETVHRLLEKMPSEVDSYQISGEMGGGWGATVVRLNQIVGE
jgi:phosphoribosylanthranilate isomerase